MKRFVCLLIVILLATALFTGCKKAAPEGFEFTCTLTVECKTILDHMDEFDPDKLELLPEDGVIIARAEFGFNEGDTVYDLIRRATAERGVHMEASYTPVYESAYVEGINNIYEFDCGPMSGWTYSVNGVYPNYGCSGYKLKDGDDVIWHYTCEYMPELEWDD